MTQPQNEYATASNGKNVYPSRGTTRWRAPSDGGYIDPVNLINATFGFNTGYFWKVTRGTESRIVFAYSNYDAAEACGWEFNVCDVDELERQDLATSDGESSSAEDRAVIEWYAGGGDLLTSPEGAFRAGFRAGEENPGERKMREAGSIHAKVKSESDVEYLKRFAHTLEARMHDLERTAHTGELPRDVPDHQSADWELWVTKRILALEKMHEGEPVSTTQWVLAMEKRIADLEATRTSERYAEAVLNRMSERIDALERGARTHVNCINGQCELIEKLEKANAELHNRMTDIEHKLEDDTPELCTISDLRNLRAELAPDLFEQGKRLDAIEAKLRLKEPIG